MEAGIFWAEEGRRSGKTRTGDWRRDRAGDGMRGCSHDIPMNLLDQQLFKYRGPIAGGTR